jgi:hypothetical protein
MAFTISGTSGINLGTQPLTGSLPDANAPSGSVVQVVNNTLTGNSSTTSTSFVSSFLTATITPSNSANKILVIARGIGLISTSSGRTVYTIYRNSTNLGNDAGFGFIGETTNAYFTVSTLDSPSTTSATTYTVYYRVNTGTGYIGDTIGGIPAYASITLMEIAA